MKIIQSFWTGKHNDVEYSFGWLSSTYNYLSWILSCNQLRKYYDDVELFTDRFGYSILIERLQLPYTKVHIVLDELNKYDDNLWALAKIKSYSLMDEPFLHVDGDVFIFAPFTEELMSSPVITQNIETTSDYYWNMWSKIRPELNSLPSLMVNYDTNKHNKAFNMGIFGGNDLRFIKKYTDASFDFVNSNMSALSQINAYNFNIFFEQVLLSEISKELNIKVNYLINEDIGDNEYKGFGNFEEIPNNRNYLHLLGFYKKQELVCNKLSIYIQKYYPEYYMHLENLLNLESKLSSFGFSYNSNEIKTLTSNYLDKIINGGLEKWNNNKTKYCRNVISEGMVMPFYDLLASNTNFYLIPLSNFKINNESSVVHVELLHNKSFSIKLLSIDYAIFNIIDKPILYSDFIDKAKEFLDEEFPVDEIKNFIETLVKRISIFISYGIFIPLEIEAYQQRIIKLI